MMSLEFNREKNILDLPVDVLELILLNHNYDEIAHHRAICRRFNQICSQLLNRGFNKVANYHACFYKQVKSHLPRRESERRIHPLARHCDVFTSIETRLSLLDMTFRKYLDLNLCCFIPGKVIDEIYRVLRVVHPRGFKNSFQIKVHEVLRELRDISSMAIEYFEEKIAPNFKPHLKFTLSSPSTSNQELPYSTSNSGLIMPSCVDNFVKSPLFHEQCRKFDASRTTYFFKEVRELKMKQRELEKQLKDSEKLTGRLETIICEQNKKIEEIQRTIIKHQRECGPKPDNNRKDESSIVDTNPVSSVFKRQIITKIPNSSHSGKRKRGETEDNLPISSSGSTAKKNRFDESNSESQENITESEQCDVRIIY